MLHGSGFGFLVAIGQECASEPAVEVLSGEGTRSSQTRNDSDEEIVVLP